MTDRIKKGETMDFEEIEELNEEDMNALYNDIVEFGDDALASACCCASGARNTSSVSAAGCNNWCRFKSSRCSGWGDFFSSSCRFSC